MRYRQGGIDREGCGRCHGVKDNARHALVAAGQEVLQFPARQHGLEAGVPLADHIQKARATSGLALLQHFPQSLLVIHAGCAVGIPEFLHLLHCAAPALHQVGILGVNVLNGFHEGLGDVVDGLIADTAHREPAPDGRVNVSLQGVYADPISRIATGIGAEVILDFLDSLSDRTVGRLIFHNVARASYICGIAVCLVNTVRHVGQVQNRQCASLRVPQCVGGTPKLRGGGRVLVIDGLRDGLA